MVGMGRSTGKGFTMKRQGAKRKTEKRFRGFCGQKGVFTWGCFKGGGVLSWQGIC
jgi:hypothetical protein